MLNLDRLLRAALAEDLGPGDITTEAVVDRATRARARVVGRESLVLSGSRPFIRVFQLLDPELAVTAHCEDGARVAANQPLFTVYGSARAILSGERTALNLLQRLCGIATATRRMVEEIAGTGCRLLDTRKTTPLWRCWEKAAVRDGGGGNHRFGLFDGILIKDNHVAAAGGVAEAVRRARARAPHTLKVEVEIDRLDQLEQALAAGADVVLLDNFSPAMLRRAVAMNGGRALLEASGGVTLETARKVAATGVDLVSCGALTHSARAIDLSLELTLEA
ncbi:MAG: nicotinate-nucleotide diphosphorylase (carboxylating) [Syntrophobacteraceae bacterium CG07_land_8_20_14_0_80_61_8]|nr:MAG: nicotinate-nucleotide diphosphorylase (carboxylating) [Syntrophobacteraceae bacterium CG07_land_8_20_14_0_80_61_8]